MKEEKHIDRNFREKLENFSVDPPAHVWSGIRGQLKQNARRRRIIYIRWVSAAAAILLAFLGGWYFNRNAETQPTITTEKSAIQSNEISPKEETGSEPGNGVPVVPDHEMIASSTKTKKKETEKQKTASEKPGETVLVAASQSLRGELQPLRFINGREPIFNLKQKIEIQSIKIKQASVSVNELTEADRALIAENTSRISSERQNESRWKLGMMVSPGYSSQVESHSQSYASNMTYSSSNGNANVTGGISIQMRTGKRWSVESGVYYDQNGQKSQHSLQLSGTPDRYIDASVNAAPGYYATSVSIQNSNVVMNSAAGIIAFDKTPPGTEVSGSFESGALSAPQTLVSSGDFSQVFDFVEIPLYLRYKIVDSRFGVEMMGGINAAMLVGNNAYLDNEYGLQNIGKTQDISSFNLSGTVGIGLNYQLGNHFSLTAEPRFNYFLSSINNNSNVDFRPYRLGFYTGVYYEF